MSILCGWAASSEYNSINGQKGDQTGREVRTGPWYYFGQNVVLRFKDRAKAKKAASNMKAICDNNNVGYGQSDRLSLYQAWRQVGWNNPSKIAVKCNTDCSQLVSDCVISVGYDIQPTNWTGSLKTALKGTGGFEILTAAKYTGSSDYLMTGDIILNEKTHVIMALEDGPKVDKADAKPATKKSVAVLAQEVIDGKWGSGADRKARLTKAGYDYEKVQAKVNELLKKPTTNKVLKTGKVTARAGLNVRAGASRYAKVLRALPYGTKVTCYAVKMNGTTPWWKISKTRSEYVCADWVK